MSMSYEDYERDFNASLARVRAFLSSTRSISSLTECDRLLNEARAAASAMVDIATVEGDTLRAREAAIRIDTDIGPLRDEVNRSMRGQKAAVPSKDELFGDLSSPSYMAPHLGSAEADTERLIQDSENLIRESQSLCSDSEQMGATTLQTMGRQREQLYISSSHMQEVRGATEQAARMVREMSGRAAKSKLFLYCVIAFLIVANISVMYHMIFGKK